MVTEEIGGKQFKFDGGFDQIRFAVDVWPLDPHTRRAVIEYPYFNYTDPRKVQEAVDWYFRFDPESVNTVALVQRYQKLAQKAH